MTAAGPDCGGSSTAGANVRFALVVDDVAMMRDAFEAVLSRYGYVVVTAGDGVEAVDAAGRYPFSLILTDIDMPRMDGIEAARRIRALGGGLAQVPIIATSGDIRPGVEERCQDAGIDIFVPKGGNSARLTNAIEAYAGRGMGQ